MIVAINYSDEKFKSSQKYNTKTAYKKGHVDKVIEYSPKDIDKEFFEKYYDILSCPRGGGYWLWKPYLVLKTLKQLNEQDFLFYCDSGAIYVNDLKFLIKDMDISNSDIMLFELPLIEKQWTKKELFNIVGCDYEKYANTNQILATYFLIRKTKKSVKFFEKYLYYSCKKDVLNDKLDRKIQCKEFIDHRHDQSLLSLLAKKEGIIPFRDPSQYGERPWEYKSSIRLYRVNNKKNSNYPKILVSNRRENPKRYEIKEFIKSTLYKYRILNEEWYLKKYNIKSIDL